MASMRVDAYVAFVPDPSKLLDEIQFLEELTVLSVSTLIKQHSQIVSITEHIPYADLLSSPFPQELIQYTADKMKKQLADEFLSKTGVIHLEQEGEWPPLTN